MTCHREGMVAEPVDKRHDRSPYIFGVKPPGGVSDQLAALAAPMVADPAGVPFAYVIYGIGVGKHYVREIKQIDKFDTEGDWKIDDDGLGEYWAGNTPLYLAATVKAVPSEALSRAQLAVATQVEDGVVTVAVHLKRGDHTTVLYSKNHALNGGIMGVVELDAALAAPLADKTDGGV